MDYKIGRDSQKQIRRRALLGGLGALCLAGCTGAMPSYSLVMDRPGNHAQITANAIGVTVQIESRSGIGRLDVAWWTAAPPPVRAIVLALAGLEHVALHWDDRTVSTAWSDRASPWATLSIEGQAAISLAPDDAHWPSITQPQAGLFILTPPASFNAAAPLTWQVAWIDFYR